MITANVEDFAYWEVIQLNSNHVHYKNNLKMDFPEHLMFHYYGKKRNLYAQ